MKIKLISLMRGLTRLVLDAGMIGLFGIFPILPVPALGNERGNSAPQQTTIAHPVPNLAYYYIWFDSNSWDRAKSDYPLLGKYTSDDRAVMRQHIVWAKAAGIDGFIVSWKSTDALNRRLEQLIEVAGEENFKLAMIYQGLDFDRNPLPVERIASDMDTFVQRFSQSPVFDLFSKPVVIWSGTWKFSPEEVAKVFTPERRQKLLMLTSERNLDGYKRLANLVDGNAYYWSSVNPETFSNYQDKLVQMSGAIHKNHGLWIAPAAPGFDAQMIGGTTSVDRKDGQTFRTQINTAMASSPDALGIISWNEFSENSYIEPSQKYGSKYLTLLSEINHLPAPSIGEFDSSEPSSIFPEVMPSSRIVALGGLFALVIAGLIIIARRR